MWWKKAVSESIASLPEAFSTIDINNAGNAHGLDPIQNGDLDDWDAMIDINVKAYCMFLKHHPTNDRKEIRSYQHRFHCCKKFIQRECILCYKTCGWRLKSRMRMDLNPFGIRVGAIHPGMVQTEFSEVRFKGDTDRAEKSRVHVTTRRYRRHHSLCGIETVSYQHCRFSSNEYCRLLLRL
jgi:NAD(P)-dependent dehydrogenase (short-subunit alcohol dehydrogenase family)